MDLLENMGRAQLIETARLYGLTWRVGDSVISFRDKLRGVMSGTSEVTEVSDGGVLEELDIASYESRLKVANADIGDGDELFVDDSHGWFNYTFRRNGSVRLTVYKDISRLNRSPGQVFTSDQVVEVDDVDVFITMLMIAKQRASDGFEAADKLLDAARARQNQIDSAESIAEEPETPTEDEAYREKLQVLSAEYGMDQFTGDEQLFKLARAMNIERARGHKNSGEPDDPSVDEEDESDVLFLARIREEVKNS